VTAAADRDEAILRLPATWHGAVPADEDWTRGYWEALRHHELSVQRCASCGAWHHPPVVACSGCGRDDDLAFEPVAGTGTIHSFSVCYREFGVQIGVPWVAAHVELDEGMRVATNIVHCTVDDLAIGVPVRVVYQDYVDLDLTLAFFEPAEGARR
jgi:hypothetical protein